MGQGRQMVKCPSFKFEDSQVPGLTWTRRHAASIHNQLSFATPRQLLDPFLKPVDGPDKDRGAQNGQIQKLRPQHREAGALQKNTPYDDQKMLQGIEKGQPLYHLRHVGNGEHKPA